MIRIATVAVTLILSLVALFGLTLALQPNALAVPLAVIDTHIVDNCDEATLVSELAAASNGDIVWIRCSAEAVHPFKITLTAEKAISKSLTIRGMNPSGGQNTLDGGGSSRIFNVHAGYTLVLWEISLTNGLSPVSSGGGCIYATGSLFVLTSTLAYCDTPVGSGRSGGAIYASGPSLEVKNSTLVANTADGAGGAVYRLGGSMKLTNSMVSVNVAKTHGAGVYLSDSTSGAILGSTFSGNHSHNAGLLGGGVYSAGPLEILDSRFTNNDSYVGGGIRNHGTLILRNTLLDLNTADYGAGIFNAGTIAAGTNLTFTGNVAALDGGGYYNGAALGTRAVFTDVVFSGNTATNGSGGGLYATGVAELTLDRAAVTGNVMKHDGGGVYFAGALITITDSTISGNRSDGSYLIASNGGGIYITGTVQPKLDRISVSGNKVGPLGKGAGLYIGRSEATSISNSQITGNSGALAGGGLYATHSVVFFWSSLVAGNSAPSGGGMYADGGSLYPWWDTVIRQNSATNGGGIYCNDCTTIMEDSTVSGNVAEEEGGGVYVPLGSMAIQRSLLDGNRAKIGGGISSHDHGINLENSTLSANRATTRGGGIASDAGTVRMRHATLKDNSAPSGGAIYNGWSSNIDLENTVIADSPSGGNCAGENLRSAIYSLSTDNTCLLTGTGNLVGTPAGLTPLAWVGGYTRVHLPKADSPLLTMIVGSDFDEHDQRLYHRPVGGRADVGAVERQDFDPLYPPLVYLPLAAKQ